MILSFRSNISNFTLLASVLAITACSPAFEAATAIDLSGAVEELACFRENDVSMLAAHRGGPAPGYAENSLSGLGRLSGLGFLYAEVDIREAADGTLFLLHDDTLERTTTGTGPIASLTWTDLRELRLLDPDGRTTPDTIPSLDQAAALARQTGLTLHLDLKSVTPARIVSDIHRLGLRDHSVVIAYTVEQAAAIHAEDPGILLSVPDEIDALAAAGVNLEAVYVWLGTQPVDPAADDRLEALDLPTSAGLFRLEHNGPAIYGEADDADIEILSVDLVETASRALGGPEALNAHIAACRD